MGDSKKTVDELAKLLATAIELAARKAKNESELATQVEQWRREYAEVRKKLPRIVDNGVRALRGSLRSAKHTVHLIEMPTTVEYGSEQFEHIGTLQFGTPNVLSIRWILRQSDDRTIGTVTRLYSIDNEENWTADGKPVSAAEVSEVAVNEDVLALVERLFSSRSE